MPDPQPVFIDFEGIDGSGKTTLSNRLAEFLNSQGIPVHHARDGGVFRSKISRAIRDLTRDPTYLRMTDVTELLLYVARDAQMIDEYIRPKLEPGHVVFSDRYLYSAITHCHHARGLPRESVDGVVNIAAGGLWPDLVVYCDVDPLTSRIRKKIQKVRDHRKSGDFGRKGLMGIGFREEMRNGFLALAREKPDTWLVIDNARSTIEESLQRIFEKVAGILEKKGYVSIGNPHFADLGAVADRGNGDSPLRQRVEKLLALPLETRLEEALPLFYEHMNSLTPSQPAQAALFIGGFDTPESHEIRELIVEREPALVAYGLRGLRSEPSMNFRRRVLDREPEYVARSLSGMALDPTAIAMREELAEQAPAQVALALRGNDTDEAWTLREKLRKAVPDEILLSLRGLDTERAWALREKRARKRRHLPALLESLGGCDGERAWELREEFVEEYMPWVLLSLRGLRSDRAFEWRRENIARAPKIIVKTLGRSDDARAWELRNSAKHNAKEVLDSISGLDSSMAWELRTALADKWPNTSVSSLGAGNQSERAWNFRWRQLESYPENVLLLKHIAKAALRGSEEEFEDIDDLDDEADFT